MIIELPEQNVKGKVFEIINLGKNLYWVVLDKGTYVVEPEHVLSIDNIKKYYKQVVRLQKSKEK